MSTNNWVSVKNNKSNMANIKLSEMIKNDDICYYCLVNRCRNNNHDRRNTKLKRCKNYFKELINNPCNFSSEFSNVFNKAIEKNLLKKYKMSKGNFYITTCTSPLINKRCYNERDGNTFDFKYKGKTFTACHKNPKNTSGKLPVCLHCDFTRVNKKVDIIPVKKMETEKKVVPKVQEVIPEEKEEIKKTDPNSWAGKLNKLDENKEEEIKDFFNKVTPFKKSISFNINDDVEQNDEELSLKKLEEFETNNKDLLNDEHLKKLEKENELLKRFISDKDNEKSFSIFQENELLKGFICNQYDERSFSNFSQSFHKNESIKLEELMIKKHYSKNKLIDIWHKGDNKLTTVSA